MNDVESQIFLARARESLAGADSEFANGRYNNCANRCYYACFQAAIAALLQAGLRPRAEDWGHDFVQATFIGELINRRKVYSASLRDTFERTYAMRERADYKTIGVNRIQASRSLQRASAFMREIDARGR